MERFEKVTEEFIERMNNLKGQVSTKVTAKDIIYGTPNEAIKATNAYGVLVDDNGVEYFSNGKFAIRKGLIPKLDEIFEENSDKFQKGKFMANLFFKEEHNIGNTIISQLITTKASSDKATSYVNSHYYRFFQSNGIAYCRAGEKNTLIMLDGAGNIAGLLLGVREPEDFDNEISFDQFNNNLKLLNDYYDYHKKQLINNIVASKKEAVVLKMTELNNNHKEALDGELCVYKNTYGYYCVGYKLKKPIMSFVSDISIFSNTNSIEGYNEYIRDGRHFNGPKQKITKAISKELAQAMYNEITKDGVDTLVEETNETSDKNFEIFKHDLALLEVVTNDIVAELGNNPLNELKFDVNNVFRFDNKASVDIKMFYYQYHFRIFVENENYTLKDVNNSLAIIKECITKEEVVETIKSLTAEETKRREDRKRDISAIREYTYHNALLILTIENGTYLASEHSYQEIKRGKTYGSSCNYRHSREEFIYGLYQSKKLEFIQVTDGGSLTKTTLDKLPKILIKDIINNSINKEEEESIEMKMLFNLQKASNENEVLQVLGDILMQATTEVTSDLVLADFFSKTHDLGKELHKILDSLTNTVLESIEESTEEQMWILNGFSSLINDLDSEVIEKIELAKIIREKKSEVVDSNKVNDSNDCNEVSLNKPTDQSITQEIPNTKEDSISNMCEIATTTDEIKTNNISSYNSVDTSSSNNNEEINTTTQDNINEEQKQEVTQILDSIEDIKIKEVFQKITNTLTELEWSITELFYNRNTVKAAIKNKFNTHRIVGIYAGVNEDNSKQIAQLLSNYYAKPLSIC